MISVPPPPLALSLPLALPLARAVHEGREELVQQLELLVHGGVREDGCQVVDLLRERLGAWG